MLVHICNVARDGKNNEKYSSVSADVQFRAHLPLDAVGAVLVRYRQRGSDLLCIGCSKIDLPSGGVLGKDRFVGGFFVLWGCGIRCYH